MKDIIFVTNQFKTGGVESVFINIAKYVYPRKIYLLPIHLNFDYEVIGKLPNNVILLHFDGNISRNFFGLVRLIDIAIKIKKYFPIKDTIVINFSDTLSTLFFSYFLGKDIVSWVHCNPRAFVKSWKIIFYKYLFTKCNKLCFICESQKSLFFSLKQFRKINSNKSYVITNSVDIEEISIMANEPIDNINSKYFLMVARLDERTKDFFTVLKAYSELKSTIKNQYKLVFAGDGPDRLKIEGYIKQFNLQDNTILLGNVENPYKYMKNASIYIHSSKSEGFSLVLLEAMTCGCFVISANCEVGPSEILDEGLYGWLFEPGNYKELKQLIEISLKNIEGNIKCIERANYMNALGRKQLEDFLDEYC